jgi:pimeloyl-ACP methyl ester carboxylesterase
MSRAGHPPGGAGAVTVTVHRPAAGDRDPTVGFVHGLGATAMVWQGLLDALPPGAGATVYGMPWDAANGSAWARSPEPRVWLARALRLTDRPPDVLVAHSFGANVVLDQLCAEGSDGYRGVVLVCPFYRSSPDGFDWTVISHYLNGFPDLLRAGILARPGGSPDPELVDAMAERVRDRIGPYGWLRFFGLFSGTPMLDLRGVDLPCLVVGGARDTASYPADCRALAQDLPRARAEILPGCGHFPMIDDPARTAGLLAGFLSDLVGVDGSPVAWKGAQQ